MPKPSSRLADGTLQRSEETGDQAGRVAAGAGVSSHRPAYVAKTAPCIASCPNGTDVRGWLVALAQHQAYGRTPAQAFELAWRKITGAQSVSSHLRARLPASLRAELQSQSQRRRRLPSTYWSSSSAILPLRRACAVELDSASQADAPRIAVVGAGPAGLSAAYHLARKGYAVTVIDAAPPAGGMMRYRIPRSMIPARYPRRGNR